MGKVVGKSVPVTCSESGRGCMFDDADDVLGLRDGVARLIDADSGSAVVRVGSVAVCGETNETTCLIALLPNHAEAAAQ